MKYTGDFPNGVTRRRGIFPEMLTRFAARFGSVHAFTDA
jgi:hypothetical protein